MLLAKNICNHVIVVNLHGIQLRDSSLVTSLELFSVFNAVCSAQTPVLTSSDQATCRNVNFLPVFLPV